MGQCWAEGIFIPQLSHRFYKLSLQLISRYHTWLNSQLYPKEVDFCHLVIFFDMHLPFSPLF